MTKGGTMRSMKPSSLHRTRHKSTTSRRISYQKPTTPAYACSSSPPPPSHTPVQQQQLQLEVWRLPIRAAGPLVLWPVVVHHSYLLAPRLQRRQQGQTTTTQAVGGGAGKQVCSFVVCHTTNPSCPGGGGGKKQPNSGRAQVTNRFNRNTWATPTATSPHPQQKRQQQQQPRGNPEKLATPRTPRATKRLTCVKPRPSFFCLLTCSSGSSVPTVNLSFSGTWLSSAGYCGGSSDRYFTLNKNKSNMKNDARNTPHNDERTYFYDHTRGCHNTDASNAFYRATGC